MTKQSAQTEPSAPSAAPVAAASDPFSSLCAALSSPTEGVEKVNARRTVGGMSQRPWQQLPGKLRRAIRADVRRLRELKLSGADIAAKGYGRVIADQALRDLGQGGA